MVLYPEAERAVARRRPTTCRSGPTATTSTPRGARAPGARRCGAARGRRRGARPRRRRRALPALPPGGRPRTASSSTCTAAASSSTTSTCTTRPARRLANRCGLAVLSVDYRRPPEHRFPAAPDDVATVLALARRRTPTSLGLAGPTYVHGDSAGGNLALVAALRHPGTVPCGRAALPVPRPDRRASTPTGPRADGFDPREAAWYWQQYAASPADLTHPDLAPLRSDRLATLPPTLVVTAEHDPLRDEGEHLAAAARRGRRRGRRRRATSARCTASGGTPAFPAAEPLTRQVAAFFAQHP